jgi:putative ABC transport system permease protein
MHSLQQDFFYGLRTLKKSPGFTIAALVTLTLGIGATSAIFSVVDAVLLRPLPFRDPSRLVMVYEDKSQLGFPRDTPAPGNYADWTRQNQIFQDIAAVSWQVYNLSGKDEEPEKLEGEHATANLFRTLGVDAQLGRVFLPEEDRPGAAHVVLISHDLWKRRYAGERSIVGREILLNDRKYTVVGVMPEGFHFPSKGTEVWTPMAFTASQLQNRGAHYLQVVARLQAGVAVEKANADLKVLLSQAARQYPDAVGGIERFFVEPLQAAYAYEVRRGLIVLLAAVGFILLIACANIANLLLSRAAGRQREVAVRSALGADRLRIVRQLMTESAMLALGGGLLGVLLADWCFLFLKNLIPEDLSRTLALGMDWRVLGFTVAVSLASSVFFGLAPALQVSKIDLNDVLKQGGRGSAGLRRRLLRNLLVVGEVALSLMLLVASGLMIESFGKLRGLNPGFQADHLLTMRLDVSRNRYDKFPQRTQFFQNVLERVRALPGVKAAGFTSALPLTWKGGTNSFLQENVARRPDVTYDANDRVVSPGYFEAMKIPLRRGRLFDERDGPQAMPVAIINETMARVFWGNKEVVGKRMQFDEQGPWIQIVGVVGDVRQMGLGLPPRQEMYFPYWQAEKNWMVPRDLAIRTAGDPLAVIAGVRQAIAAIDRDQPIADVKTMDEWLDEEVAARHVQSVLLGSLAALALILACVGIYGVLSYVVTQRTQEIGVRVALGASAGDVFSAVAKQGMGLAAIGIGIGAVAALAVSRLLQNLLFEVKPTDPVTYVGAGVVFALVALVACYVPARRAAKVDPLVALRYE